jgi:hypothetical protein
MYSWDEDTSGWYGKSDYAFGVAGSAERADAAARARAAGPRKYSDKAGPNMKIVSPHKHVRSESPNPLIIAVDVTGSMASWPFEIFDRLPLLFNTLSQYRPDLEICFAAIGDGAVDQWPLQVTSFASGFDLEQQLGALYGEGGGGDAPESYGLFSRWVNTHVQIPNAQEKPFMIVFGDITMHPKTPRAQVKGILGDDSFGIGDFDALNDWRETAQRWNTWFLRRPNGKRGDDVDKQWAKAIGEQKILHIQDEQRAVDYAMGLVARAWGNFDDFKNNMLARQTPEKVGELSKPLALICPRCGAPIPHDAFGLFKCAYCSSTLKL